MQENAKTVERNSEQRNVAEMMLIGFFNEYNSGYSFEL